MPKETRSHVDSKGRAYFKNTGRYNEVTKAALNSIRNDASAAVKQENLAPKGNKTAAAITTKAAMKELGW